MPAASGYDAVAMATDPDIVTACLIVIGNEILSGRTRDANLPFLARTLNDWGVRLREARVIPDDTETIVATVNECRAAFDHVFTSGGIGPTHDDITAAAIAKAFGVALVRNPEAVARLEAQYDPADLTEARLKMADIPEGATLIDNPVSRAPGFRLENVFVLAGVPVILQAMVAGLRHEIAGGRPMLSRTVTAAIAEGVLAPGLAALQEEFPDIEIGSYPFFRLRKFGVSVVLRGTDPARLDAAAAALKALLEKLGGKPLENAPGASQA